MFYVHLSQTDKPYLDDWSNDAKDGYQPVPAIMDSQILALTKFPTKCYLDDSGALVVPNQIPASQAEQEQAQMTQKMADLGSQIAQMQTTITQLQSDKTTLEQQLKDSQSDDATKDATIKALQSQVAQLMLASVKPVTNGGAK